MLYASLKYSERVQVLGILQFARNLIMTRPRATRESFQRKPDIKEEKQGETREEELSSRFRKL